MASYDGSLEAVDCHTRSVRYDMVTYFAVAWPIEHGQYTYKEHEDRRSFNRACRCVVQFGMLSSALVYRTIQIIKRVWYNIRAGNQQFLLVGRREKREICDAQN
eukprot:scaffold17065_cov85-Skeletonema_dohrnii-CCMP3373.AAC.4